jgi:hypothetical protein
MKKIMTLAVIALASVAMVSCCGQPKKAADACCCDKPATECATCPQAAECPQAAAQAEVAPEAPAPAPAQ